MRTILLALAPAPAAPARPRRLEDVDVQLLGINDFHGNLEPTTPGTIAPRSGVAARAAGGAEYLATHIRQLRGDEPATRSWSRPAT